MKYSAGSLKHTIYIEKNTAAGTTDDNGNPAAPVWVSITTKTIRAAKKGLTGRVFYEAAAAQSEDNILFVVRYNSATVTTTTAMRIVEGVTVTDEGTTYDSIYTITAPPVDVDDQRQWLEIHTEKVDVNGG